MLNLNYYFVDVGENYCFITERSCLISLRDILLDNDSNQLKIAKEFLTHAFKKNCIFSKEEEFKMVFVNKVGKMLCESYVENNETMERFDPIAISGKYDAYTIMPGQNLYVKCQVVKNAIENRYLSYESIRASKKVHSKKF